jgi:transposase
MQDSGHTSGWHGERVERVKVNGKRVFCTAFKTWLVAQAGRPGVSVAALAMRHEINANQLRRWMRLEHLARPPAVLPVTLAAQDRQFEPSAAPPRPAPICSPIEIEVSGAIVRVHHGADAVQLRMVLQALRA